MLNLDTFHLYSLMLSFLLSLVVMLSFLGMSRNRLFFYGLWAVFPLLMLIADLLFPQQVLLALVCSFGVFGSILGIKKICTAKFSPSMHSLKRNELVFFLIMFFALLSRFLASTYFRDEGTMIDATTYHMGGPKEWTTYMNGVIFNTNNPVLFTASYWEYFNYAFTLPFKHLFELLAPLAETHYEFLCYTLLLTAQLLSAFFGFVLVPLVIYDLFNFKRLFAFIVIGVVLSLNVFTWLWPLAKNNVYPVFVSLVGLLLIVKWHKKEIQWKGTWIFLFSGMMFGLAVGAKFTCAYALTFILPALMWDYRKSISTLSLKTMSHYSFFLIVGGGIGLGGILLRNYLGTGNPIFPMDFLVKNPMILPSFEASHHVYSQPSIWAVTWDKMRDLYVSSPLLVLMSLLSFYFRLWFPPVFFFSLALFNAKVTGPASSWPHKVVLLVYIVSWLYLLFLEYEKISSVKFKKYFGYSVFILFILLTPIRYETIFKRPYERYFLSLDQSLTGRAYYWEKIKKENMAFRSDPCHVVIDEYGGYFSRFPFIKTIESNPDYRHDYFKGKCK